MKKISDYIEKKKQEKAILVSVNKELYLQAYRLKGDTTWKALIEASLKRFIEERKK